MNRPTFTRQDQALIRRRWRSSRVAWCPRCDCPMEVSRVPQPEQVAYVRRRSWLACPGCGGAVVADDPREVG